MGCVSFFKSMWPEIKSNAALFIGKVLKVKCDCKYIELLFFYFMNLFVEGGTYCFYVGWLVGKSLFQNCAVSN